MHTSLHSQRINNHFMCFNSSFSALFVLILIIPIATCISPSLSLKSTNTTSRHSTNVTSSDSLSLSTSMIELTSIMDITSSMEFISSTEHTPSSSSSPTPTLPPPPNEILVQHIDCFYLEATNIDFLYFDQKFKNTSAYHLALTYPYVDTVTGCTKDSTEHTFTRQYRNITNNNTVFIFTMEFTHDRVEDSWRLSSIQNSDFTLNGGYIFVYADCGHAIDVPDHLSYFCSEFDCYGHEQVIEDIKVKIAITNLRVDAFVNSGSLPSSDVSMCGVTSASNKGAFLVVALVIGATLTLTVIIIIASFVYKRCKYGRYNLLD